MASMNENSSNINPLKITELADITLTAGDAFLAMGKFLLAYCERTDQVGSAATICADVQIEEDGMAVDPAALSDWMECVHEIIGDAKEQ